MADFDPQALADALKAMEEAGIEVKDLRKELSALTNDQMKQLGALSGDSEKAAKAEVASRKAQMESIQAQIAATKTLAESKQKELALNKLEIEQLEELLRQRDNMDEAATRAAEKRLKAAKERNKELTEEIANTASLSGEIKKLAGSFSVLLKGSAPDPKSLLNVQGALGLGKSMLNVVEGLGKTKFSLMGVLETMGTAGMTILTTFTQSIINLAIDMHDLETGFMKATGATQEFARSITNVYEETREYGVTAKEASAAGQSLFTTFTDFTFASEQQRESLIKTGAILSRLGIGHQDFAASVQISTKALGMSREEAGQNMLDISKFARNLGVAPQEMARNFAGAGNMMAKMGVQGVDAFKDLAIASKVTGMEMQKILQITDKFDTFEGAAEMAGKLNAAIGGNFVNAMDLMMTTDPAERFDMIRDSLSNAGLEFDNMSYYQKKFFAESMGLSDVNDLALIMSGNTNLVAGSTKENTQSIIEAAKAAQTMATFQEKLNMAFVQLIPVIQEMLPQLVKFAEQLITWAPAIANFIDQFGKMIAWLIISIKVFTTIVAILKFFGVAFAVASAPVWGLYAVIAALVGIIVALGMWLFKKSFASTFLEGLTKLASAFGQIAIAVLETLNPITQITKLVDAFGSLISGVGLAVTSLFTALSAPEAADNIMKIGKAIADIPIRKNVEFAASMTAAAVAATAAKALGATAPAAVTGPAATGAPPGAPGRTTERALKPVTIELDGVKMAEFVVEIIGENVYECNFV